MGSPVAGADKGTVVVDTTVMTMLHEHVPLTLLWDLFDPQGPRSAEIMAVERGDVRIDELDAVAS